MNKTYLVFIGLALTLVVISSIIILNLNGDVEQMKDEDNLYQGPVPEGYDEEHFRKTGETIQVERKK